MLSNPVFQSVNVSLWHEVSVLDSQVSSISLGTVDMSFKTLYNQKLGADRNSYFYLISEQCLTPTLTHRLCVIRKRCRSHSSMNGSRSTTTVSIHTLPVPPPLPSPKTVFLLSPQQMLWRRCVTAAMMSLDLACSTKLELRRKPPTGGGWERLRSGLEWATVFFFSLVSPGRRVNNIRRCVL